MYYAVVTIPVRAVFSKAASQQAVRDVGVFSVRTSTDSGPFGQLLAYVGALASHAAVLAAVA